MKLKPRRTESVPMRTKAQKDAARERRLIKRYGIDKCQWCAMYQRQRGKCALCFKQLRPWEGGEGKLAAVDHNPVTGEVRGLVCCNPCNRLILGNIERYLRHDANRIITMLSAIINYVLSPPAREILCP